jgi:hypothetical protein
MYTAVLTPQLLFGSSTWFIRGSCRYQSQASEIMKALESIQHNTLYQTVGAFKTMPRAAFRGMPPRATPTDLYEKSHRRQLPTHHLIPVLPTLQEIGDKHPATH